MSQMREELQDTEVPPAHQMILVVEDDDGVGAFLVQAISQETSYQALRVADGFEALRAIEKIRPALFILDYQLPQMNGIELYDRLHALKPFERVPAIVISARLPRQEIEKRNLIGMNKPLELDELLQTIEGLLL